MEESDKLQKEILKKNTQYRYLKNSHYCQTVSVGPGD